MALYCLTNKEKEKEKKIKLRKIDKNKRKIFKSKYTITLGYFEGLS